MEMGVGNDVTERVRLEVIGLLARTSEVDLGTIYRTLVDQLGREIVADIGTIISRLVREGAIEIDTRRLAPDGPHVGFARLVLAIQPPYQALVA